MATNGLVLLVKEDVHVPYLQISVDMKMGGRHHHKFSNIVCTLNP